MYTPTRTHNPTHKHTQTYTLPNYQPSRQHQHNNDIPDGSRHLGAGAQQHKRKANTSSLLHVQKLFTGFTVDDEIFAGKSRIKSKICLVNKFHFCLNRGPAK